MSNNSYLQSINNASDLFLKIGLRGHYNNTHKLPSNYVSCVRNLSYYDQWSLHNSNHWYHIKLSDQSLILFKPDSFKFMMSPFEKMDTLQEFEDRIKQEFSDEGYLPDEIRELTEDIENLYQDYLDTELETGEYTPIRFDYHPNQYHSTHHSVSHLHIGHNNESRIPIKKIMTPYAFCGFIISTFYPKEWEKLRTEKLISAEEYKSMNRSLKSVTKEHNDKWCPSEEEDKFFLV